MIERIGRLFAHGRQDIRLFGFWGAVPYFADRILTRASAGRVRLHKYWIVAQPVEPPAAPTDEASHRGFELRRVTQADARYEDYPRPEAVIRARFRNGGQCLAAYRQNVFVGYIWFSVGPYDEDEVRCRFVPLPRGKASWDYDAYVVERYRLGRAFKLLWDAALASLDAQGVQVSYSRISAFNSSSVAAHTRMGARRIGTLMFFCAGSLQCMISSLPPYVSLSDSRSRSPELDIERKPRCRNGKRGSSVL